MGQQWKPCRIKAKFMRLLRRDTEKLLVSHPGVLQGSWAAWGPGPPCSDPACQACVHSMSHHHVLSLDSKGLGLLLEVSISKTG